MNIKTQDQKVMNKNQVKKGHHNKPEINTQQKGDGKEPKRKWGVLHKIEYKHEMKPNNTYVY
jgi:hypothetical protein